MDGEGKSQLGPKRQATNKTTKERKRQKLHHDKYTSLSGTSTDISQLTNTPDNNKISVFSKPLQPELLNTTHDDLSVMTPVSKNRLGNGGSKTTRPESNEDIILCTSDREEEPYSCASKTSSIESSSRNGGSLASNKNEGGSYPEEEEISASETPYSKNISSSGNNRALFPHLNEFTDGTRSDEEISGCSKNPPSNGTSNIPPSTPTTDKKNTACPHSNESIDDSEEEALQSSEDATSDGTDFEEEIFHESTRIKTTRPATNEDIICTSDREEEPSRCASKTSPSDSSSSNGNRLASNKNEEGSYPEEEEISASETPYSKNISSSGNNRALFPHLNESTDGTRSDEEISGCFQNPPSDGSSNTPPSTPTTDKKNTACPHSNESIDDSEEESLQSFEGSDFKKEMFPDLPSNNATPTNTTSHSNDLLKYINHKLGWNLKCSAKKPNNKGANIEQETQEGEIKKKKKDKSISDILFPLPKKNSKKFHVKKKPLTPKKPVKRNTVSGDEYQRVLQILVRQRVLSEPESKVGTEVAGVGKLDDIVYIQSGNSGYCRFFQAKHCKIKKISINDEFLKTKDGKELPTSADFYLLSFFRSFLKEHDNIRSKQIEEIVFITERGFDLGSIDSRGLFKEIQNSEGYNDDDCLNLKNVGAIKYKLDLDWLKAHNKSFIDHLNSTKEIVDEFFKKLRVIVSYLDHKSMDILKYNGKVVEVNSIDDIVYEGSMIPICRFFVSYTKDSIKTKDILRTQFPGKFDDYNLHLLLYLKSFLDIKRHKVFANRQISEITFVTNRRLESDSTEESPMEEEDLKNDKCLNLQYPGIKKLKLRQDLKDVITTFLLAQPRFGDVTKKILEEFLDKIRLVVGYPDLEFLMKSTFDEVFDAEAFGNGSESVLSYYALHMEVCLLIDEQEFCTSENWQRKVDGVISKLLRWFKITGISDLNRQKLALASYEVVSQNTNAIKPDVSSFVKSEKYKIMSISVMNLESNAANVIKVLHALELTQKIIYLDLEDLLAVGFTPSIMDFFQENNGILVLTCGKQKEKNNVSELVSEIGKCLTNTDLNIILLSRMHGNNAFCKGLVNFPELKDRVVKKKYIHKFKDLTYQSQKYILSKDIIYQGIKMTLGSLLGENIGYASKVIDESILWKIIESEDTITVGQDSFITSEWYEQIPRFISRRYVSFRSVKKYSGKILFIIKAQDDGDMDNIEQKLQTYEIDINVGHSIDKTGVTLVPRNSEQLLEQIIAQNTPHCVLLCMDSELYFLSELGLRLKLQEKMMFTTKNHYIKDIVERIQLNNQGDDSGCRVNILAADSGVGKSTFLAVMETEIKKANPNVWVSKIELRSIRSKMKVSLEDLSDNKKAVKLLSFIALGNNGKDQLGLKILKIGLQMKQNNAFKMVVLLDGYNEINEEYREKVCTLVDTLQTNCNIHSIWISTQTHKIVELENRFNEAAFFLNDLTVDDQVKLMVGAWKNDENYFPNDYSEEQLTNDATTALTDWVNTIDDTYKSFTTIPLNVIMLAKVLMHNGRKIKNITNNMNLSNLYNAFVMIKIEMFNRNTREEEQTFDEAKDICFADRIHEVLMQVAAKYYFDLHTTKKYDRYKTLPGLDVIDKFRKLIKEDNFNRALTKIGLVKITTEIDFTHESFGQFFFAEYVLNNINNEVVQIFFVSHLFKAINLQLCRRILNSNFGEERSKRKYNLGSIKIYKRASKSLLNASLDTSANCMRREQLGNTMAFIFHSLDEKEFISYKDKVIKLYARTTWQNSDSKIAQLQSIQYQDSLAYATMQNVFCTS